MGLVVKLHTHTYTYTRIRALIISAEDASVALTRLKRYAHIRPTIVPIRTDPSDSPEKQVRQYQATVKGKVYQ